jgi:lipoprotein-anchoring transpeptidase ErfK/SrfK
VTLRRRATLLIIVAFVPAVLAGCTGNPMHKAAPPPPPPPPTVTINPANGAKDVPTSGDIGATVTGGRITDVTLSDDKGARVDGGPRSDGSGWMPSAPLRNKQAYVAQVTAVNKAGQTTTQTSSFTTMDKPAKRTETVLNVENNQTYGVAMPVVVRFEPAVPKEARADVQRRLFVTTDPPQRGAWHWIDDGTQVFYRAPDFWRPGTKINVRSALSGMPAGNGSYGDADRTATATIGNKVSLEIDNATKQMSVYTDDKLARKIPVSLGKARTPTSSGNMVIMEKFDTTVFDTRGDPEGGYVVTVANAQRLTRGGEFIHAAPWSVGDQGNTNVSHGCTNVSDDAAAWLMGVTHVGDLVSVRGTEVKLEPGNGWTAWDMSWGDFIRGSALPVPVDLKPTPPAPPPGPAAAGGAPATGNAPATAPPNGGR